MKRKTVSGIMLTLLFIGMLTSTFNIKPVRASGTIYIKPDGSVQGTDKIQRDGDLYTLTGDITSDTHGIVIERNNMTLDGAGFTVQGRSSTSTGITLVERSNLTIRNMEIRAFGHGIYFYHSSNISVFGNAITGNVIGIAIWYSSSNKVSENTIIANSYDGIWLDHSSYNNVSENHITANNVNGIRLTSSSYNNISGNTFVNNGLLVLHSRGNVVSNNLVNSKPLVYLEDVSDYVVEDAGQVILINCTCIRVENLNLSNTTVGVQLWETTNTTIAGNKITENYSGIELWGASYINVFKNDIASNTLQGIGLHGSSNNTIYENNVFANNQYGIGVYDAWDNIFYHNNFVNNAEQVYSLGWGYANTWDDGFPSGGNYWSDYEEKYPDAEELDDSGLWDTPYVIDENNQDNYPLMEPWILAIASVITVSAEPATVTEGSDVTVSGEISPVRASVNVTIFQRLLDGIEEWAPLVTTKTDQDSRYAYVWKTTQAGTYELKASWLGDEETAGAESEVIVINVEKPPVTTPTIDIDPDTLNLKSKGRWITVYIEFPEGYDVSDIDRATILLNDTIPVDPFWVDKPLKSVIEDYDEDGTPDLMVKFKRAEVIELISADTLSDDKFIHVTLSITGQFYDGTPFESSDTIRGLPICKHTSYKHTLTPV